MLGPRKGGEPMLGDESILMRRAAEQVTRLEKAVSVYKWMVAAMLVLLIAVGVGGFFLWQDVHDRVNSERAATIASCVAGNEFRSEQQQVWAKFIAIATQGDDRPATHQKALELLTFIAKVDQPRNCAKLSS